MAEEALKKRQKEYIAIAILVLVALFIGINRFRKKETDDEVFSKKEFNRKWKEVEMLELKLPQEEKGITYTAELERIPFRSPFEEEKGVTTIEEEVILPVLTFQGMIWNSARPQVIINNQVYNINDTIETGIEVGKDDIKIKDITKEGIYLKYRGKEFIVRPK